jgi:hypothetical protein
MINIGAMKPVTKDTIPMLANVTSLCPQISMQILDDMYKEIQGERNYGEESGSGGTSTSRGNVHRIDPHLGMRRGDKLFASVKILPISAYFTYSILL